MKESWALPRKGQGVDTYAGPVGSRGRWSGCTPHPRATHTYRAACLFSYTNSLSQAPSPSGHLGFHLSDGSTHSLCLLTQWAWALGPQCPETCFPSTQWSRSLHWPRALRAGCQQRS